MNDGAGRSVAELRDKHIVFLTRSVNVQVTLEDREYRKRFRIGCQFGVHVHQTLAL